MKTVRTPHVLAAFAMCLVIGCFDFSLPEETASDASQSADSAPADAETDAAPPEDGGQDASVGACTGGNKRIFLSSTPHAGSFGGLDGADTFCQGLAVAAKLGGTWKAYLSTESASAASRMTQCDRYRMDGVTKALSYFGGDFAIATAAPTMNEAGTDPTIDSNESNVFVSHTANVWIGSRTKGLDCEGWVSGTDQAKGVSSGINSNWLATGVQKTCTNTFRVYCVEQ